jgi:sec-independent protein translocase protein TatB
MFDLGLTELLVIGIVALIIVGPKDLPVLFRRVGEFVGRMKGMAREFTSAMNEAADQAGVKDVAKTMKAAANPVRKGLDKVGEATKEFTNFDPMSETGKLASERVDASKKIREAKEKKGKNNNKGSKSVIKSEKNNKSRPKKNSKSENKK